MENNLTQNDAGLAAQLEVFSEEPQARVELATRSSDIPVMINLDQKREDLAAEFSQNLLGDVEEEEEESPRKRPNRSGLFMFAHDTE